MFNDYVWKNYLDGKGKDVVSFFEKSINEDFTTEYAEKICDLHKAYCPSKSINNILKNQLVQLYDNLLENDFLYGCYNIIEMQNEENLTIESFMERFYEGIKDTEEMKESDVFDEFTIGMPYYTTFICSLFPDRFVPYYFQWNFNIFEMIAQEFEIDLPEMPIKKDYKGRFMYYGEICEVLYEFRIKHNMSPYELYAFLYDFAPKYVGGIDSYIIKDLPEPRSAYFIGGTKDDCFLSEDEDIIALWQCSPDTMAGDNIVMYLKTPISSIDSVWRSVSVGFNDPFFYYYRCTYIAHPKKLNRISQNRLKKDNVFKELPIVKKNMQGINGVELFPSVYNHLLDIAKSDLPRMDAFVSDGTNQVFKLEKDVEEILIKPFIGKLGYSKNDYQQQFYIPIGNHNHALISDFVINPKITKGHQSGDILIEAKISITSKRNLEVVKTQARSYAKMFNAKYSLIASQEGIWLTGISDDYSEDILSFTWDELKIEDNFIKFLIF